MNYPDPGTISFQSHSDAKFSQGSTFFVSAQTFNNTNTIADHQKHLEKQYLAYPAFLDFEARVVNLRQSFW